MSGPLYDSRGLPYDDRAAEPVTEAGKALLAAFSINERDAEGTVIGHVLRDDPVPLVRAIEAQAQELLLADVEGLARAMQETDTKPWPADKGYVTFQDEAERILAAWRQSRG